MQLLPGGSRELFDGASGAEKDGRESSMSETPVYKPEKFVSIGELLVKLVLKKVNYNHLWFKRCPLCSRARL